MIMLNTQSISLAIKYYQTNGFSVHLLFGVNPYNTYKFYQQHKLGL